ncbi:hypothetical protein GQ600_23385 [Phytophthora cactorum]|nr:hypothetical protein GQ600_23385 [Phytophthora cactorum]
MKARAPKTIKTPAIYKSTLINVSQVQLEAQYRGICPLSSDSVDSHTSPWYHCSYSDASPTAAWSTSRAATVVAHRPDSNANLHKLFQSQCVPVAVRGIYAPLPRQLNAEPGRKRGPWNIKTWNILTYASFRSKLRRRTKCECIGVDASSQQKQGQVDEPGPRYLKLTNVGFFKATYLHCSGRLRDQTR